MRVIRTEMYFDPVFVKGKLQKNPGIDAGWFRVEDADPPTADDIKGILDPKNPIIRPKDAKEIFEIFIDLAIQNVPSPFANDVLLKGEWSVVNREVVLSVLNSEIVSEGSPLEWLPIEKLKASAAVVIGTFIGYGVADGNYPLMFITIPAGIVVIGSAIGVSRGLENGLNQYIQGLFRKNGKKGKSKGKGKA